MTLIEVFDRLLARSVNRIDFRDGSFVVAERPLVVDYHDSDTLVEAWIEPAEDGLVLHFNDRLNGEMRGQMEPLTNIVRVV